MDAVAVLPEDVALEFGRAGEQLLAVGATVSDGGGILILDAHLLAHLRGQDRFIFRDARLHLRGLDGRLSVHLRSSHEAVYGRSSVQDGFGVV